MSFRVRTGASACTRTTSPHLQRRLNLSEANLIGVTATPEPLMHAVNRDHCTYETLRRA
jgi:hypothetical protein